MIDKMDYKHCRQLYWDLLNTPLTRDASPQWIRDLEETTKCDHHYDLSDTRNSIRFYVNFNMSSIERIINDEETLRDSAVVNQARVHYNYSTRTNLLHDLPIRYRWYYEIKRLLSRSKFTYFGK